ncbi:MAG: hypothetical protein OXJ63_03260 [Gammaproteobacteria bacterium]|nr:hypothetical protein [Gammaproteobacteria bacterium]
MINRSDKAGEVTIEAFDDEGASYEPLALSIGPSATVHFDSFDLEDGNTDKGLSGSTGPGRGDWRLELSSDLDIAVLSYIRTSDGFIAPMHGTAPWREGGYRVAIFNPGSDRDQESLLRLVNRESATVNVAIHGVDDAGATSAGAVIARIPAGAARTYSASELESGKAPGLDGSLGDGDGRWRLAVRSDRPLAVMGLLSGPAGRLKNLSNGPADGVTQNFEFSRGEQGFVADFADYPPDDEEIYELTSGYRPLPSPLEPESALYLSGVNRSDDLVMFFKGQVAGLVAGAAYSVSVSVEIATDTPAGCVGVGGAPGESVWIKAGASEVEPLPVLRGSYLRMNIDIGNQSNGGGNAVVLGNMANSRSCEQPRQWERKSFQALSVPETVSASADGRAWLLFGTDSGFESRTEVYFTRATVTFTPTETDGLLPASDPIPLRWLPPRKDRPDVQ